MEAAFEVRDRFPGEGAPPQTNEIEGDQAIAVDDDCMWRNVVRDRRVAADHCATADPDELLDSTSAAEEGMRTDIHVSSQHHVVGDHNVAVHPAVVSDVAIRHEIDPAVNDRVLMSAGCSVDRHAFPDRHRVADPDTASRRRIKLEVLRIPADHGEAVDLSAAPEDGARTQDGVCCHGTSVTDSHPGTDDSVRSDRHLAADLCPVPDDGRVVDCAVRPDADRAFDPYREPSLPRLS